MRGGEGMEEEDCTRYYQHKQQLFLPATEVSPPIVYYSHLHWAEYDIMFIAMMAYQQNQYHYIL